MGGGLSLAPVTPAAAAPPPAPDPPLRIAVIFTDGHADYARAFTPVIARQAEVLLIGPRAETDEEPDVFGQAQTWLTPWPRHRQAFANLALLARMAARIRAFKANVVHVLSEGQVWLNLLPALIAPTPVVVTLHDVTPHPGDADTARVPRALVNRFVRRAAAVLVHGDKLKADAVAHLRLDPARVSVGVHPPNTRYRRIADVQAFARPLDGRFRLLFFGRIFPYKGLAHLIAAEPAIAEAVPGLLTVIAGRGEDMAGYRAAMADPARFDVRDRRIPDGEVAELFAQADLLVLPYVEASQSGVLAIAAAFGLPVVATDVGEIGPLVRQTGMGRVVPPADPAALARAVVALATDPAARLAASTAALAATEGPLGDAPVWAGAREAYAMALRTAR